MKFLCIVFLALAGPAFGAQVDSTNNLCGTNFKYNNAFDRDLAEGSWYVAGLTPNAAGDSSCWNLDLDQVSFNQFNVSLCSDDVNCDDGDFVVNPNGDLTYNAESGTLPAFIIDLNQNCLAGFVCGQNLEIAYIYVRDRRPTPQILNECVAIFAANNLPQYNWDTITYIDQNCDCVYPEGRF